MRGCMSTTLCYVLALCLYAYTLGALELCHLDQTYDIGYTLLLSSYFSVKRSSLYSCAAKCKAHRLCRSVNFRLDDRKCFLNWRNKRGSGSGLLVESPLFAYSERSRWPKEITGPCSKKYCSPAKRCTVQRTGKAMCGSLLLHDFDTNSEYELVHLKKTWNDAKEHCEIGGGRLAKVDTPAKYTFLELFANMTGQNETEIFLGGSEEDFTGDWRWVDGTSFNYSFWQEGQPEDEKEKNCLSVCFSTGWGGPSCLKKKAFMCERKL
ncbi:secretory phospholipase A2 receptor-like [Haliotis rufescens]|uniref:secretory phospholipase A2 receptor-like n=1 Tax=Haliotis rufescens TaxID=6454 RepID=UPI00201F33A4|nr:secretory phospholipase A2 receptor-like [Haliotis rufescens]